MSGGAGERNEKKNDNTNDDGESKTAWPFLCVVSSSSTSSSLLCCGGLGFSFRAPSDERLPSTKSGRARRRSRPLPGRQARAPLPPHSTTTTTTFCLFSPFLFSVHTHERSCIKQTEQPHNFEKTTNTKRRLEKRGARRRRWRQRVEGRVAPSFGAWVDPNARPIKTVTA